MFQYFYLDAIDFLASVNLSRLFVNYLSLQDKLRFFNVRLWGKCGKGKEDQAQAGDKRPGYIVKSFHFVFYPKTPQILCIHIFAGRKYVTQFAKSTFLTPSLPINQALSLCTGCDQPLLYQFDILHG